MSHRLWTEPDGSIKIETFAIDTPDMRAYTAKVQKADGRIHPDATFMDLSKDELTALLPADRSARDQWVLVKDKKGTVAIKAKGDLLASDQQVHADEVSL
jgi:hypothetical protein